MAIGRRALCGMDVLKLVLQGTGLLGANRKAGCMHVHTYA